MRRRLRQRDVAVAAGCSRARIGQVEHLRRVPRVWTERYRRAVAEIDNAVPSTKNAASVNEQSEAACASEVLLVPATPTG